MFALGIIALVLQIMLEFQIPGFMPIVDGLTETSSKSNTCYRAWAATTCVMVRLCNTLIHQFDSINH